MTLQSIVTIPLLFAGVTSFCCTDRTFETFPSDSNTTDASKDSESGRNSDPDIDAGRPPSSDRETDTTVVSSCGFDYERQFSDPAAQSLTGNPVRPEDVVAPLPQMLFSFHEPEPPYTFAFKSSRGEVKTDLILPAYEDDMPLFERASPWAKTTRCFELKDGARLLTESEAFDLYRRIAETVTEDEVNDDTESRTVIGIRGAYPGEFAWNGNAPGLFNDTLVLLFVDEAGRKNVREFEASTDVGVYDFGFEQSSFLPAGRSYRYRNGFHGDNPYSALIIDETDYLVMNDTNANGHWDDDRNGRLPPPGDDYYRTGFGHNIHVGSVNAPLGTAPVGIWSAGCQLICGMAGWTEFITNAWTSEGEEVRYFLIDARDIEEAGLDSVP
jgi:hypothetical protein